tara:strand:+ start:181 stop:312 length:132 start_codon:yes stop_codon:yes gene_type:complete
MTILQPLFAGYANKILSAKKQIGLGLFISGVSLIAFPFLKMSF